MMKLDIFRLDVINSSTKTPYNKFYVNLLIQLNRYFCVTSVTDHIDKIIARPRFELGSRAPKAPMLDRYTR